jgi:hypothetical protein
VDLGKLAEAIGVGVRQIEPYHIKSSGETLKRAAKEDGGSLAIASRLCDFKDSRRGIRF